MLFCLDGPDRSGKSTVHGLLRPLFPGAVFVSALPLPKELFPVMEHVDARQMALWEQLYDPERLYIVDRGPFLTSLVYGRLYGRRLPDMDAWRERVFVCYFRVPLEELRKRHAASGDALFDVERYSEVLRLYEEELMDFSRCEVDGTESPEALAEEVSCVLRKLTGSDGCSRGAAILRSIRLSGSSRP